MLDQFELNLARVLAASVLFETRQLWSPGGIVDDAVNESPDAPDVGESTEAASRAYARYLPSIMGTIGSLTPYMSQQQLLASQATSPAYAKMQANLYRQYGPHLAETAQRIDATNKMSGANADLNVLRGPGKDSVAAVTDIMRETDPEFFKVREAAGNNVMSLLSGGLTPAEEEAISRRLLADDVNRGVSGVPSQTRTVSNAMQFGEAARNRQLQGVAAANSFLPASRTGLDVTQVALGRPSINTGDSKFQGVQQADNTAANIGNNFFNQVAGFQTTGMGINAEKRDWMDRLNEGVGSINF
jgi:hypothetical protein